MTRIVIDDELRERLHGLQAENGGTGVPPVFSEKITRRHLPHWQLAGATYFLTWRCASGITLTDAERDTVLAAIQHWDGSRWDLFAAVVMPDHVHVLACPLEKGEGRWDLGELLHSVKSFSAHQIAKRRKSQGRLPVGLASRQSSIWQDERYDRWVRDEDELAEKVVYILGNPVTAGLVERPEDYRWLYQKTGETPVPPVPLAPPVPPALLAPPVPPVPLAPPVPPALLAPPVPPALSAPPVRSAEHFERL